MRPRNATVEAISSRRRWIRVAIRRLSSTVGPNIRPSAPTGVAITSRQSESSLVNAKQRTALRILVFDMCVIGGGLLGLYVGLQGKAPKGVACTADMGQCVSENLAAGMKPVLISAGIGIGLGLAATALLIRLVPFLRGPR